MLQYVPNAEQHITANLIVNALFFCWNHDFSALDLSAAVAMKETDLRLNFITSSVYRRFQFVGSCCFVPETRNRCVIVSVCKWVLHVVYSAFFNFSVRRELILIHNTSPKLRKNSGTSRVISVQHERILNFRVSPVGNFTNILPPKIHKSHQWKDARLIWSARLSRVFWNVIVGKDVCLQGALIYAVVSIWHRTHRCKRRKR